LVDPAGRSLVLVFTDCVAAAWHDGRAARLLETWARRGPVALLQALPEHAWSRSALGGATPVRLSTPRPAAANSALEARALDGWPADARLPGTPVLAASLEPTALAALARLLAGAGGAWAPGFVFDLQPPPAPEADPETGLAAQERVARFWRGASPLARRLAGLLGAAPAVSLPVLRLVRQAMLPAARQVHEAEVLLGGLLFVTPDGGADADPDEVRYEFHDGVRSLLLDAVPAADALSVLEKVSSYVEDHLGQARGFRALLADPAAAPGALGADAVPFARVAADVLWRLGGEYARLADRLPAPALPPEEQESPLPDDSERTPFCPDIVRRYLQEKDPQAKRALLNEILTEYLPQMRRIARVGQRTDKHRAEALVQDFVLNRILKQDLIGRFDPPKGDFVEWLFAAFAGFAVRERLPKTVRQAPSFHSLDSSTEEPSELPSDALASRVFIATWYWEVLNEAVERMRAECDILGRRGIWEVFERLLVFPSLKGTPPPPHDRLAGKLGLANYLYLWERSGWPGLARSVDVTHRHLGLTRSRWTNNQLRLEFRPVDRTGTPINDPAVWHPFTFGPEEIQGGDRQARPGDGRRLLLFLQRWQPGGPQLLDGPFGSFDLDRPSEPLPGDEPSATQPFPPVEEERYEAEVRLRGARRMEIRVLYRGERYGPYPLVAAVPDPESILQG
jgi:hypothetical protein